MIRTWRQQTLTGNAQPWFGDVLTAAAPVPANNQYIILTVADTTLYEVGDRIHVGFGSAGSYIVKVNKILSATKLQCQSESDAKVTTAFAINTIIALADSCFCVEFNTSAGNANLIYLGTDNTVTSAGLGSQFHAMQGVETYKYILQNGANPLNTAEGWMAGTAGQFITNSFQRM